MSLTITVTFDDSANGSTTDTFMLNDADAATLLSVLSVANAPGGQRERGPRQQQQPAPPVVPLTYDVLYHQIAQNFWLGLSGRVSNIQLQAAQTAAMTTAEASVTPLAPTSQTTTTPVVQTSPPVSLPPIG